MAKMRKVKRSLISALLLGLGRLMLRRVQKRTMRSVTRKPRPARKPSARLPKAGRRSAAGVRSVPSRSTAHAPIRRFPWPAAGKGLLIGLMSAVAVAALKTGVEHVVEAERDQHLVTPDFDVFSDDDE